MKTVGSLHMRSLKKFLICALSFLFLLNFSLNQAYAGGVPMPQYTTSVYTTAGGFQYVWYGNSGYYVPKLNYVNWGAVGGANFYSGSVSATWFSQYTNQYNELRIEGWNGSSWVSVIDDTDTSYFTGDHTLNKTYAITGNYTQIRLGLGGNGNATVTATVSAVVADQSTVQAALDAANAANQAAQATVSYAQNASTQASNASSYANQALNWLNGTWGGYSLGTVGQNATNAMNNSASANTNATNAYNQSFTANNTLNNSTYGLNAINNNVNTASTNAANAVTSIATLQNNMAYLIPPDLYKVTGYNNATATSNSSLNISLNYSNANEYQVKVDNGAWSGWLSLSTYSAIGYIPVGGISGTGMHTIYVNIRNNNGAGIISPVTSGQMTMFKL